MSGCCPSCIESNSPEIVPVTVSQTVIQIDDAPVMHRTQRVTYDSSSLGADKKTITLDYVPYEARSVQLAKNSGVQRYGVDFTVLGDQLVVTDPLISTDELFINYVSVDGTTAVNTADIGSIVNSASTDMTDQGYLLMDGATAHAKSAFADLWTFLQANPTLVKTSDTNTFTLIEAKAVFYSGATLVTMNSHIKASTSAIA